MGDHQCGNTSLLNNLPRYFKHFILQRWAQSRKGFIKQQKRTLAQQYPRQSRPTLLPA
jgi:hypothetical protein